MSRPYRPHMLLGLGFVLGVGASGVASVGHRSGLGEFPAVVSPVHRIFACLLRRVLTVSGAIPAGSLRVWILAFHFAARQHDLNQWEYASNRARAACAVAVECARPFREDPPKVSGLPDRLRGVPFLGNGFKECIETGLGDPVHVRFTDSPMPMERAAS